MPSLTIGQLLLMDSNSKCNAGRDEGIWVAVGRLGMDEYGVGYLNWPHLACRRRISHTTGILGLCRREWCGSTNPSQAPMTPRNTLEQ